MKSFEEMYSELEPYCKEIEKKRKASNRTIRNIMCVPLFILIIGIMVLVINDVLGDIATIIFLFTLGIGVCIKIYKFVVDYIKNYQENKNKRKKSPIELYKENIIEPIIKNIFPTCEYNRIMGLHKSEYYEMLHHQGNNAYWSDDLISGDIINKKGKKLHIRLSDVSVGNAEGDKLLFFYFQGIMGNISIDKEIPTYLKITTTEHIDKKEQILMDVSEFEKYFNVESPNKILAMQILTTDIMLNMIEIWNKTNIKFEILIKSNTIKMCFFTGDMFSVKLFGTSVGKKILKNYNDILEFVKNISIEIYDAIDEADV